MAVGLCVRLFVRLFIEAFISPVKIRVNAVCYAAGLSAIFTGA